VFLYSWEIIEDFSTVTAFIGFLPSVYPLAHSWENLLLKDFQHSLHSYGFWPVWVLMCCVRMSSFWRFSHNHSTDTVWMLLCLVKENLVLKAFPHWLHSWQIPLCEFSCNITGYN
jgi:hypothetical protein